MEYIQNEQLELAYKYVQYTNKNVYLTGKAGTGKTTFLHNLKHISPKRMIVVAPTGVAAINAGGVTIHSFFQMPFGPYIPKGYKDKTKKFNKDKIKIIKTLDLLVIDEVSMVRADLLDGIDEVLRRYRDRNKPFGGVQLLMIGDLNQLPPIVKDEEWEILKQYYSTLFFFGSLALQKSNYISIELKQIFRQTDKVFISLLNKIRENKFDDETLNFLNKRYQPGITQEENEGYIILTTHNYQSQKINEEKLKKLETKEKTFTASTQGDFPEYMYPTEKKLVLKEGAQVMFVKNDTSRDKLYYNGKIGTVLKITENLIKVKCKDDYHEITVGIEEWQNCKYVINETTKEIDEIVIGRFFQYPLKLAWAITIHKSQGLTFEKAIIDANSAFAFGQVYVALSRCKSLNGLILCSQITNNSIKSDSRISDFNSKIEKNQPDEEKLQSEIYNYQKTVLLELFDFNIIKFKINPILKNITENQSTIGEETYSLFREMDNYLISDILNVADKFKVQITKLIPENFNIEENTQLLERIFKASTYFYEKIENQIYEKIKNLEIETDNKTLKKNIEELFDNLFEECYIKLECLKFTKSNFQVKKYLEIKSKSAINIPKRIEKKKHKYSVTNSETEHPDLIARLKLWRDFIADEQNIDRFKVLQIKSIQEIAEKLPVNIKSLQKIKGIGKIKAEMFGDDIVEIVKEYCHENNIKIEEQIEIETEEPKKEKKPKGASKNLSFEMYSSGMTIEQIAKERNLAVSTIQGHLSDYISTGEIDITELMDAEKIELIAEYFLNNEPETLSEVKKDLGEDVSYSEISFVQNYLEFVKKQQYN